MTQVRLFYKIFPTFSIYFAPNFLSARPSNRTIMNNQTAIVEKIHNDYTPTQPSQIDELRALDKAVKRPANIFAYTFGTIGSLILGTGMCLAMKIIGAATPLLMPVGIGVGLVGLAMVSANYFLYKKLLTKRKAKYAAEVLALSNKILGE